MLDATEVNQSNRAVVIEEIIAPVRVSMNGFDLQHLKIEKLEEMRAQLIPKFLRRPLSEEIFKMPASH